MSLSRAKVRQELEAVPLRFEVTLYGYELRCFEPGVLGGGMMVTWRLCHAGGVSGEGERVWWMEKKPEGAEKTRVVRTVVELRRLLREYMAGLMQRPEDRPGFVTFARLHRYGDNEEWLWFQRRKTDGSLPQERRSAGLSDDRRASSGGEGSARGSG